MSDETDLLPPARHKAELRRLTDLYLRAKRDDAELRERVDLLFRSGVAVSTIARTLGVTRQTIYDKIRRHRLAKAQPPVKED